MKLSLNLLSEFIDLSDMKIAELADLLTMKTCEVEGYAEVRPDLDNFLVAEVRNVSKHPDADKLSVCEVFDGTTTVQIVTGAPNVRAGKKYPMAPVGVTMPGGLAIKPAKLRGVDSNGMLCSASELELESFIIGEAEDGLLTLPDSMTAGSSIRNAFHLNDFVIEIDNKSITHRPDLWGHFGFAREISALTGKTLRQPDTSGASAYSGKGAKTDIAALISGKSAIAYSWACIDNVSVEPAPLYIQARLYVTGMRPINNIVDTSNYIMLELGQPNHAFDRNQIRGPIEVAYSRQGEEIELLDGRKITTGDGIALIRDNGLPVALAGVMGGKATEVAPNTTKLFLESATFRRPDIRKAVSTLGIRTESSQRFEKGQNPENSLLAIHRFITLLGKINPEISAGEIKNISSEDFKKNTIRTSLSFIKSKLGHPGLENSEILRILESLSMTCQADGDSLTIHIPVYRSYHDIEIPEDIVEEIGRVIGYNQIKPEPLMVPCKVPDYQNSLRQLEHLLRKKMCYSYNFTEAYNYAFHSQKELDMDHRYSQNAIRLLNPLNQELEFMRTSPLPGLLQNVARNHKEFGELRFFEIERIFLPREGKKDEKSLPEEKYFLAGILFSHEDAESKLSTIQSIVSNLLTSTGCMIYKQKYEALSEPVFHPGRAGKILYNNQIVARWGELHPELSSSLKITERVVYFEIFLEDILPVFEKISESNYVPVIKYPASEFEFTVLMDLRQPFSELLAVVGSPKGLSKTDETVIEEAEHLTTYSGDPIPAGKKAVSVKIKWRNAKRTLQHDELKNLQENMVKSLESAGFNLR